VAWIDAELPLPVTTPASVGSTSHGMTQTALFLPDPYNAWLISNIDTGFLFRPLLSVAYVTLFAAFAPMAYRGWPCT
jgi:hypothetical protein